MGACAFQYACQKLSYEHLEQFLNFDVDFIDTNDFGDTPISIIKKRNDLDQTLEDLISRFQVRKDNKN